MMKKYKISSPSSKKSKSSSAAKPKKFMGSGLRIVDDSDTFGQTREDSGSDQEADEMPQVAGLVDERPTQIQEMEMFRSENKWKQVGTGGFGQLDDDRGWDGAEADEEDRPTVIKMEEIEPEESDSQMSRTLDGKRAGLQTSAALREEMLEFRRKEDLLFAQMDDSISGRGAKSRVRSRLTAQERAEEEQRKVEEAKKAEERKKQYDKWGKGLKQVEDHKNRLNADLHETSKPLARYKDDRDLDKHFLSQERDGDPLLEYMKSKGKSSSGSSSGPKKKSYMGAAPPPNRFKISPGYRWDGVDRSNGYEKSWFGRINDKKANLEDSYKWSVEDL